MASLWNSTVFILMEGPVLGTGCASLVIWYPGHVPARLRMKPPRHQRCDTSHHHGSRRRQADEFPGPVLSQPGKSPGIEAGWPIPLSEIARNPYPEDMEKIADQTEPTSTTGAMKSLVTPQRHMIMHEYLGTQIYDTSKDLGEQNNLLYTARGRTELSDSKASLQKLIGKAWPDGQPERLKSHPRSASAISIP